MRLMPAALCLLGIALAACGSSSYSDTARSAVSEMRDVLQRYNTAHPRNLAATGQVCHSAFGDLGSKSGYLATATPTGHYRAEAGALRTAYSLARGGFRDCARAAATDNYPLMARAEDELNRANSAIRRARSLDR